MTILSLPSGFTFSQSSLQDYSDCPRRFQLRYVERLKWPGIELEPAIENERRQQEGQLFHRLIQQYLVGIPSEKLSQMVNTPELSRWWENFLKSEDLLKFNDFMHLYTELILTVPVGSFRLQAKYDLIAVKPGGKAIIFDWKTYHRRVLNEWMAARMQTRVYRAVLIQAGSVLNNGIPFPAEQIEMVYWFAEFPMEIMYFPYNTKQTSRDRAALTGLINEISNHQYFPLTEDEKKCAYCPFRSYCNRGDKAGTIDEVVDNELVETDINFEQIAEIEF
jgi:CRISPR/Cas system-associated exonuclease Cas4 (RecB family)